MCNNRLSFWYQAAKNLLNAANVLFNHLKLSHYNAITVGGLVEPTSLQLCGTGNVTLVISNCVLFNGSAMTLVDYGFSLKFNQLLQLKVQTLWIIIVSVISTLTL